jgi:4-hydroxy-3-polyprenylbenzoate decarboxylase
MRIIVWITGGSGAIYSVSLLQALHELNIETHLVVSKMGEYVLKQECDISISEISKLSTYFYSNDDFTAPIASGSFKTDGMVVAPCSMKTLSAIANGYSDNLLTRACDVIIKEGKKLVLVPRETPLSSIHLENMLKLSNLGLKIFPPIPSFYNKPNSIEDIVIQMTGRILDNLNIDNNLVKRWNWR